MSDRVSISVSDGVADVRLNRPEKMNALDPAMFSGLIEAGREVAENPAVRAVVLSGNGRAFCAGLDMASFQAMGSGEQQGGEALFGRQDASPANRAQRPAWIWQENELEDLGIIE